MNSQQVSQGAVGINHNAERTAVLIQVTDDEGNQARAVLTLEQARFWYRKLGEAIGIVACEKVVTNEP